MNTDCKDCRRRCLVFRRRSPYHKLNLISTFVCVPSFLGYFSVILRGKEV